MAKNKKEIKKLYKNLQEVCSEMSDHISCLSEEQQRDETKLRYLKEFIRYKEQEEEYHCFRENAYEEYEENMPFSNLTL